MAYGDTFTTGPEAPENSSFRAGGQRFDLMDPSRLPPGLQPMEIETAALNDPNSAVSNALYFGGARYGAEAEMRDRIARGEAAQGRGVTFDESLTGQSMRDMRGWGSQLAERAAGGGSLAGSPAMQDLRQGFAAANALAQAGATSARGSMAARAAAARSAGDIAAGNAQNQAIAANQLGQAEQIQAIRDLGTFAKTARAAEQDYAYGKADTELTSRGINDEETRRQEDLALKLAGIGMQGRMNRQDLQAGWLKRVYGGASEADRINRANRAQATDMAIGGAAQGTSAFGQITQGYGGSQSPTRPQQPTPKPSDWEY